MKRILFAAFLSIAVGTGCAPAGQAGPDVTSPYNYVGAGQTLSPLGLQQLTIYRDQLQALQREQQLQVHQGSNVALPSATGPLKPLGSNNPATASQNLSRTQTELDRINGLLNQSRTNQMLAAPPAMVVKKFPPQ
jgi:hypothetical protein